MTELIFSFDTEDFTSNAAADAIVREAEILTKHGVRGCFCVVGLLAKQLKAWGRTDVIDALKHHEIGLHTLGHTLHPMISEYTDTEDFEAARREVIRQEGEAVRLIKETFGVDGVYAAVPPGNAKSYAAMYAYADMGIPVYADTFCDPENGSGSYYCNMFHAEYAFCCEGSFFTADENELKANLDELAKRERAVIYTHPNASLYSEWWDILNYDKQNLCEFGHWKECKRRPAEQSEKFYENLERTVCLVKNDPRFRIVTYRDVAERNLRNEPRIMTPADLEEIRMQLNERFFPVTSPASFSLSDIFYACVDFLNGKERHVCGKTFGFLSAPFRAEKQFCVTGKEMRLSAESIAADTFIPEKITVGENELGPADWLYAALDILCGAEQTAVTGREQLPSLDILPQVRDASLKGTWRHSDTFEDKYLSDRLRLQCWTMRFPAHT